MESLPYVVIQKRLTNDSEMSGIELSRVKKKARMVAKLFTQVSTLKNFFLYNTDAKEK